ncbi:Xyloglucanase precursor [compost metagenome]
MGKKETIWSPASLGGGGYITGLIQHPTDSGVLYARCDVAGVFASTDGGFRWEARNGGLAKAYHHQVQSFAISPQHPEVLFRCSGEVRSRKFYGSVHKSADGGHTWREVCTGMGFYGNGPTRMYGEVIAADPHYPEIVAAGGYTGGLWISRDEGETWNQTDLPEERFGCVAFHPGIPGMLYAGTISDDDLNMDYVETGEGGVLGLLQDRPRGKTGRLYASTDLGESWVLLHEGPSFAELAFDSRDPQRLRAACIWNGIRSSQDGGRTWQIDMVGLLAEGQRYGTVVQDIHDPERWYTAPDVRPHMKAVPPIPLYVSGLSGGDSRQWQLLHQHKDGDLSGFPAYMDRFGSGSRAAATGWAISKIIVDRIIGDRIYLTNWYGVAVSSDGGRTWCAAHFQGLETTCMEAVIPAPQQPGKFCVTMADHPPKVTEDGGRSFWNLPGLPGYSGSTAAVISRTNHRHYLYGLAGHGRIACIAAHRDGEENASPVLSLGAGLFVQALREDGVESGIYYAYVDGPVASGAGIYRSSDGGMNWERTVFCPPSYMDTLPHHKNWIEAELLAVVVYQVKNACGANQMLAASPYHKGRILAGEWTEGIWESRDGGDTWESIGEGLPFQSNGPASVLNAVAYSQNHPDTIYAGFISEGLWRSVNGGRTWSKLYPAVEGEVFNVSALTVGAGDEGEDLLILASEPMAVNGTDSRVVCSRDGGSKWQAWHQSELGAVRWKGIALDCEGKQVLGVSCGNGAFHTRLADKV